MKRSKAFVLVHIILVILGVLFVEGLMWLFSPMSPKVIQFTHGQIFLTETNTVYNFYVKKMPSLFRVNLSNIYGIAYEEISDLTFDVKAYNSEGEQLLSRNISSEEFNNFGAKFKLLYRMCVFLQSSGTDGFLYGKSYSFSIKVNTPIKKESFDSRKNHVLIKTQFVFPSFGGA